MVNDAQKKKGTLSPVQVGLLVVVGVLTLSVQVLILRAFINSVDAASLVLVAIRADWSR